MKKVLLATTVLAMSATVASAEVTLSGSARMGVLNGFAHDAADKDLTSFSSRVRVVFGLSGETDGGIAFGASIRADNAPGGNAGTAGSVFMSYNGMKLSMGDVDGAAQMAVGHVDGIGYTGLFDANESFYLAAGQSPADRNAREALGIAAGGDPTALFEYTTGPLSVYASVTNPGDFRNLGGAPVGPNDGDTKGIAYALGGAYTIDNYKVSLGYEKAERTTIGGAAAPEKLSSDHWILGGDATFGQITVKARYGKADLDSSIVADNQKFKQASISATYKMDAISATMYYNTNELKVAATGVNVLKVRTVGLGGSYDLGGGASIMGGIAQQRQTDGILASTKDTAFDLGVSMSF